MGWKKEEDGLLQFLSTLHHSLFWATFGDWLDSIVRPKIVYIPSKMTWIICCWPVVVIEQVADCLTRVQCSSGWIGNDDTAILLYSINNWVKLPIFRFDFTSFDHTYYLLFYVEHVAHCGPENLKKSRQKNSWAQINQFFFMKIDFWPFLKLQKIEFGLQNYLWNWLIWFHEFFGLDFF